MSTQRNPDRRSAWLAWILLIAALLATAAATSYMKMEVQANAKRRFDFASTEIHLRIDARMDANAQILRSAAAFFDASDEVTRERWHAFTVRQNVEQHLPGIQGIGFSLAIPRERLAQHIQEIQGQGFPNYNVKPAGERELYSSIVYLEPFSGRNLFAFGYDMFSESVRRKAMEQARDLNVAALSGKVILLQETGRDVQAGTLMYAPVYRKGMPFDTLAHRQAALLGWVYSPYRMNDLMQGILRGYDLEAAKRIRLEVFDDERLTPDSLLYDSQPKGEAANASQWILQYSAMFNDHLWHLRFTQAGGRLDYGLAYGVLAVGTIISLLVFGLFRSQLNAAERKREEESLRQSERFVQATIDALSAQLCVLDESGRIIAVNRAWREFALANQGDLEKVCEGANYLAVCDAATDPAREDGGKIAEGIRSVMQGRLAEFDYEFSCHSSTRESWFFSRVTRFCASGLNRIVVTHENTTERRQAQEDLQQATERLSLAVRAGGVGIWDYDIANNRLVWDDQMFRLYGIQRDQFGGAYDAWTAGLHPEDRQRGDEEIQAALRGEREFDTEFRVLWPDGTTHSIRAMACVQRDGFGKPLRMNGTNWDITTFKQADENLRTLSRAVEFSPSMILVTDHLGKIQYVNPAWEEKTGYRMEEARGRRPSMLKSGTHAREFYANMWSEIGAGRVWRGELCNRKKNGELFWESTAIAPVHNKAGVTIHFVAVKEDITERKRAAEQLRQAKETAELANKAKSTFLANMSHEIRTPMNAILGFSQLMLRDLDVSVVHREQLTTIARSGEHLMDIINDILEMARVESGRAKLHPSIFDLHQLLTDIKSLFTLRTQARNLRLSIEIHEGLPRHILADETKLRQVIINLLGNAVKFTPTGGAIILRAGISGDANSMLRLNVEVEDSGAGIAPGDIEHLFEPFYQTSIGTQTGGGTGLGLPISREFVRLMGGDLTVSSRVGSGSTFRFDVRITRAEESGAMAQTEPERRVLSLLPGLPAWRVLEVDDEDHNRELIECLLAPAGFELRSACNGVEAVEQCKAWSPHLVLLDLRMPVMDGFEAARRIRAEFSPAPKIIALSACAFASDRQQAMAEGADAFIAKPFQTADLFETIRQLAGVEYVYSNSKTAEAASQAGDAAPLPCAEELQRLPSGLVEAFLKAIRLADYDQMLALVDQMAARDEPLGRRFRQWVQKFDYDTLLKVLSPNINNEKEIHE